MQQENTIDEIKGKLQTVKDVIVFVLMIGSALLIWNIGKIATNTESPIVVVMTGSMEPAFQRGDLLLATHWKEDISVGDIVIFKVQNQSIPIVHRAIIVQINDKNPKEKQYLINAPESLMPLIQNPLKEEFTMLTKGDNNQADDRGLYPTNQIWLNREHIIGKIRGYMPFVGYLTILINDYPLLKYLMMGLMIFSVMINKEKEKV